MGNLSSGGVNLDYVGLGQDCDTTATIYLFDGGPFVIRQDSTEFYTWGTSLYQSAGSPHGFIPLGDIPSLHFTGPNYQAFRTGTFVTADSTIGMRATYYAPTDLLHLTHCAFEVESTSYDFVIGEYKFFSRFQDTMHHVTLGFLDDWDVPAEPEKLNSAKDANYYYRYISGSDTANLSCIPRAGRIGGSLFLGYYTTSTHQADLCFVDRSIATVVIDAVDSLTTYRNLNDSSLAAYLWTRATPGSKPLPSGLNDYYQLTSVRADALLLKKDTITAFVAYFSARAGNADTASVASRIALGWNREHVIRADCRLGVCCWRATGNIDMDPGEGVDISDLSALIGFLYIDFEPVPCFTVANVDGDPQGAVDIADISRLIDHLYISFAPLACCHW